ncbi:NAD(P)-binding domain-containing protein [Leisingera sp. McT4-56]|uniref:NAD(P)-binding domain-containing protein n=1 Tax=Leisingera sp. McT4-56 TaxID=2881255 RepID=UPI001CF834D7|nr:NAD(P)-binding domain-containing protein [Leisingera sp. McT4-56]MCB4458381.1 NAD(P)-binding domain-containing protein [Leisingera sp. McT4-56]
MKHVNTVIIGGGQAGLAMGRCLFEHGIDYVILERGRIGERWHSERWDSLKLLTPNWQSRLPHGAYDGGEPDAFMSVPDFIERLERYARSYDACIERGTTVTAVQRMEGRKFRVATDRGEWCARNVVVATGFCDTPRVPDFAENLPDDVVQIVPPEYRNPSQVPEGHVLVVGASATGLQIAEELLGAGRSVTVSVGTHIRVPRRYRGRDILYWMDATGGFAAAADPADERGNPPPQLVGSAENRDLDLSTVQKLGARLAGRTAGVEDGRVLFADTLRQSVEKADRMMFELLGKIDGFIEAKGYDAPPAEAGEVQPVPIPDAPAELPVGTGGVRAVVWATGYQRKYPWLKIPVLDERGEISHKEGISPVAGLYVLGMRFQKRKYSNLIDGVGRDAEDLAGYIAKRTRAIAA